MRQPEENLLGAAHRSTDRYRVGRDRNGDARSMRAPLVAEVVGRKVDSCVLAMSGELSRRSVASATGIVSKALNDEGRVVVDLSSLRTTARPAAQVFPSALTAVGGWPAARLVLFGADPELATSLTVLREMDTVPLAADEPIARQLLQHRPPAVARHLDVDDDEPFAPRRARLFVTAACQDWQLDAAACDDAVLVASELVGNAIAHARTACRLNVRLDARGLTIAVRDYDYGGLLNPLACTSAGRRGQGLFLVASVSRAWGATPTENGKRVWALLPITTAAR